MAEVLYFSSTNQLTMSTSDMLSMLSTCTSMPTGIGDPSIEQSERDMRSICPCSLKGKLIINNIQRTPSQQLPWSNHLSALNEKVCHKKVNSNTKQL